MLDIFGLGSFQPSLIFIERLNVFLLFGREENFKKSCLFRQDEIRREVYLR